MRPVSNRKYQHYWLTSQYSALRVGEYKYMLSSISDDDTDVLNPGGFTGVVQRYGYGRLYNLYLDPKETRSYMIRKLVYIDAIIGEIGRHHAHLPPVAEQAGAGGRELKRDRRAQRRPISSATWRRSFRKSGCAMSTRRCARSRTVRPVSSAAPYSVMTTPVWWRGVETTEPSGRSPTMRDTTSPSCTRRRVEADERVRVEVQLGRGHEVLVAAHARDLLAVDVVGHHLAVEVD